MRNLRKMLYIFIHPPNVIISNKNIKKYNIKFNFDSYDKNFINGSYLASLIVYWICIIKSHLKTRCNKFQLIYIYAFFPDGLLNNLSTDTV